MRDTVVLVPGLGLGGAELVLLASRLRGRGYRTRIFWHVPWRHGLPHKAARLNRLVSGLEGGVVHFVGHSFGGLIILRLFQDHPDQPSGRVVMLGAPVNGCQAARRVQNWPFWGSLVRRYMVENFSPGRPHLLPGRQVGGIAGTLNLGVGWLLGLARPNDSVVSVEEALHEQMQATAALPLTHSSMLLSGAVVRRTDSFLRTGRFAVRCAQQAQGSIRPVGRGSPDVARRRGKA